MNYLLDAYEPRLNGGPLLLQLLLTIVKTSDFQMPDRQKRIDFGLFQQM